MPWTVLVGFAALVRLPLLFELGTLWNDEAFSRHFARLSLGKALGYMTMDVHPPLHLIVLHFWIELFGATAISMRAMSFCFALVGIALFLRLARMLLGKRVAVLAGLFVTVSPIMVYYGVDARMYAMLFCLACASGWLFWRVVQGDERACNWWMWVSLALVMTHVTGVLVLTGQVLFLLVSSERRPLFWKLLWRFALIAAVFCLWFIPAAAYRLASIGKEWQFRSGQEDVHATLSLAYWVFLGVGNFQRTLAFVVIALLGLAGLLNRSKGFPYARLQPEAAFLGCWFLAAFAPFLVFPNVSPRYLVAAIPPFFLLLARGFLKIGNGKLRHLLLGCGLVCLFAASGLLAQYSGRPYSWDTSAQWILDHRQTGDRVVFAWYADAHIFESLDDSAQAALGKEARGLYPFDDKLDEDGRYAAHAGTLAITRTDLDRYAPLLQDAQRVFFVPNFYMVLEGGRADLAIAGWLNAHGWFLADQLPASGRTPGVWLLVRKEN